MGAQPLESFLKSSQARLAAPPEALCTEACERRAGRDQGGPSARQFSFCGFPPAWYLGLCFFGGVGILDGYWATGFPQLGRLSACFQLPSWVSPTSFFWSGKVRPMVQTKPNHQLRVPPTPDTPFFLFFFGGKNRSVFHGTYRSLC